MAGTPPPSSWNVLVVDDEVMLRRILERTLVKDGHRVTLAENGEEALAKLKTASFDLMLIDKNLPPPDGVELAQTARRLNDKAVIVMLTAYASKESADKLVGIADEYLTKPFELENVRAVLNALMERKRKRQVVAAAVQGGRRDRPMVQLVVSSALETERIGARVRALGYELSSDRDIGRGNADVLVLSADGCSFEVRQAVWKRQAEQPAFKVVLLVDPGSLGDSVAAVSLRAAAKLSHPLDDGAIDQALKA